MAFKQEVNVPLIFTIGVISGVMLLVIVIGTQAWYQSEEGNEIALKADDAQREALDANSPTVSFAQLKQTQLLALQTKPHYTDDKKKDRVAVSIDDAKKYFIEHDGKMP